MEKFVSEVSWKSAADDDGDPGALVGYLAVFGNVDLQDDVIERGAFKRTVKDRVNRNGIPLLADHDQSVSSVIGTIAHAEEDNHGLRIKATFASTPDAQTVRTKMLEGHVRAMSIGYEPLDWQFRDVDGRRIRVLKQVKLWEGSVVVFPANEEALVTRVKAAIRRELKNITGRDVPEFKVDIPAEHARDLYEDLQRNGDGDGKQDRGNIDTPDAGDLNAAARRYAASRNWAMEDGSYPIRPADLHGASDLDKAIRAVGRGSAPHDAIRRHIIRRARALGLSNEIPDNWNSDGSLQGSADAGVEPDTKTSHQEENGSAAEPAGNDALSLAVKMARAEALLNGRDPDEVADSTKMAGITSRLDLLDSEVTRLGRIHELRGQLDERMAHVVELRRQLHGLDRG